MGFGLSQKPKIGDSMAFLDLSYVPLIVNVANTNEKIK